MSNKNSMSHNACYASPLSNRAVPLGFNVDRARFRIYINAHSDTSHLRICFYQYHGMYWYCITVIENCKLLRLNSVPFVSMRNATADCAAFLRCRQYVNDTPNNFRELVKIDSRERAQVAAELNKPMTKWI